MAKRFTDTDKWQDPWFRNLDSSHQRFWMYILDRCDAAGVWKVDFESVEFHLKTIFDPNSTIDYINKDKGRIIKLSENYWFLPDFLTFQYGELSTACKPHNYVLKLLEKYKIKGYPKGIHTLKDKDKEKVKEKDKRVGDEKLCVDCNRTFFSELTFRSHLEACRELKAV